MTHGTTVNATVLRVVDGDTLRVRLGDKEESLRISALDTEESNRGSSTKPVTPHGKAAKQAAQKFFPVNSQITLEFAGSEPLEVCLEKYRDNYGRLLVFVHKDGKDYQEHMILEGYSPYFVKYGNVNFPEYHQRYIQAERKAQSERRGIWDQIQANGSEINNYALLTTWWHLRAAVIDEYRSLKVTMPAILNTRLDYARLIELAKDKKETTVFTELRSFKRIRGNHLVIDIGSQQQPFQVFIADLERENSQQVMELLVNRYLSDDVIHPRRNYAYVTGALQLFQNRQDLPPIVQLKVTSIDQITDYP
ncbi:MAG: thermonuclease family protein [Leptolyngbyaceae cyanobacterium HOT.MB2.61]|nr:thermonuclease family protein [Leptolyngbyaceae cyanobacterium HOT.MB2.61]